MAEQQTEQQAEQQVEADAHDQPTKQHGKTRDRVVHAFEWIRKILGKTRSRHIIERDEIERILPHRDRMLLLHRVIFTRSEIVGEVNVTEEMCEGHCIGGKLIVKGSDWCDMAAQLVGVGAAYRKGEDTLTGGETAMARGLDGVVYTSPAHPGERVTMTIAAKNLFLKRGRLLVGEKIKVAMGEKLIARIGRVSVALVSPI